MVELAITNGFPGPPLTSEILPWLEPTYLHDAPTFWMYTVSSCKISVIQKKKNLWNSRLSSSIWKNNPRLSYRLLTAGTSYNSKTSINWKSRIFVFFYLSFWYLDEKILYMQQDCTAFFRNNVLYWTESSLGKMSATRQASICYSEE